MLKTLTISEYHFNLLHIVTLFRHSVRSNALLAVTIGSYETSTRSFANVHCVVISFPGTKVHGDETSIIPSPQNEGVAR